MADKKVVNTTFDFANIIASSGNKWLTSEDDPRGTIDEWIDTGSYTLNAVISGSLFKGIPNNRVTMFEGEPATGKTYFVTRICRAAVDMGYKIVWFDSENAVDSDHFKQFGFPSGSVRDLKFTTVEELKDQLSKIVDSYEGYFNALKKKDYDTRSKIMVVVDSVGNMTTQKAIADTLKSSFATDMGTKAKSIKSVFTELTTRLGCMKIPMILTNHVSADIGSFMPTVRSTGGRGALYNASTIIRLNKSKEKKKKNGKDVVTGIIIKAKSQKNRFCRPDSTVQSYLDFSTGLNRYFGLMEWVEPSEISKTSNGMFEYKVGAVEGAEKKLFRTPYCDDVLGKMLTLLDARIGSMFKFGSDEVSASDEDLADGSDDFSSDTESD